MEIFLKTQSYKQKPMRCGSASLKIVAEYYGIPKTEKHLARLCRTNMAIGTTGENLLTAGQKIGLTGKIVNGANFRTIASWLKKDIPVIVNWFSPGQSHPVSNSKMAGGHYSVVVGLTDTEIVLEDPGPGKKRHIPRNDFMRVWFDYDVAQPRSEQDFHIRRLIVLYPKSNSATSGR